MLNVWVHIEQIIEITEISSETLEETQVREAREFCKSLMHCDLSFLQAFSYKEVFVIVMRSR